MLDLQDNISRPPSLISKSARVPFPTKFKVTENITLKLNGLTANPAYEICHSPFRFPPTDLLRICKQPYRPGCCSTRPWLTLMTFSCLNSLSLCDDTDYCCNCMTFQTASVVYYLHYPKLSLPFSHCAFTHVFTHYLCHHIAICHDLFSLSQIAG